MTYLREWARKKGYRVVRELTNMLVVIDQAGNILVLRTHRGEPYIAENDPTAAWWERP